MNKKIELLAPAGDMKRLQYALNYGADAIYLAGEMFGMRTNPSNFSNDQLEEAVDLIHSKGKKVHITCNTLPRSYEIEQLIEFLKFAGTIGVDAFIIADIGVMMLAKKYAPNVEIHMSTQVGIVNYQTANTLYELGAKRVVLARELSLEEIKTIRDNTPPELEIETFIHGAMCMSFSGRCILSDYMTNRDPNRGDCAQPCRWKYSLVEEKRPGEYFNINQEDNGTYIFNSRDLCMLEHISDLYNAGIDAFKIEGRAKSEYYTAIVTHTYRHAIDEFMSLGCPKDYVPSQWILDEINKVSHREYTTGFYYGPMKNGQVIDYGGYVRGWDVCGVFLNHNNGRVIIEQRNRFYQGDKLEIVQPFKKPIVIEVKNLFNESTKEYSEVANRATDKYSFDCDLDLNEFTVFRVERHE